MKSVFIKASQAYLPQLERVYRRHRLVRAFGGEEGNAFGGKILVASHQRSGTHLTINTLLLNTNLRKDYAINRGSGSRLDRKSQLHKTHCFAEDAAFGDYHRVLYVFRDPVDVLFSYYRFITSPDYDWAGSPIEHWDSFDAFCGSSLPAAWRDQYPRSRDKQPETFIDWWVEHLESWRVASEGSLGVIRMLSFERILDDPALVLDCLEGLSGISCGSINRPSLKKHPSVLPGGGLSGKDHVLKDKEVLKKIQDVRTQHYEPLLSHKHPKQYPDE